MRRNCTTFNIGRARALWELYALAQQQAEDALASADGLKAAQAFWALVESFMPQVYDGNVVSLNLRRGRW